MSVAGWLGWKEKHSRSFSRCGLPLYCNEESARDFPAPSLKQPSSTTCIQDPSSISRGCQQKRVATDETMCRDTQGGRWFRNLHDPLFSCQLTMSRINIFVKCSSLQKALRSAREISSARMTRLDRSLDIYLRANSGCHSSLNRIRVTAIHWIEIPLISFGFSIACPAFELSLSELCLCLHTRCHVQEEAPDQEPLATTFFRSEEVSGPDHCGLPCPCANT